MKKTFPMLIFLTLFCAASTFAGISVDHDKSADFSKYKSFSIAEATPAVSPLMRQRLIAAIEESLTSKGLKKAAEEAAHLHVVIHASVEVEQHITADNWGYGGWRGWGGWGTTTVDVQHVTVGTLLLDIVDASSNQLVWRGIATDSIPQKTAKQERRIHKAVEKLFRHFPPE